MISKEFDPNKRVAAIEAGGTKIVCALVDGKGTVLSEERFPTIEPKACVKQIIESITRQSKAQGDIHAIGIGSFGPLDLNKSSETYGYVTTTPKAGWNMFDLVGAIKDKFDLPIGFDTDVNAAALGEGWLGSAQKDNTFLYITVGTGLGVGVIVNGMPLHGLIHPEAGHIRVQIAENDPGASICPYHNNCLEGLSSGPSVEKRWNSKAIDLDDSHEAWDLEALYLAQGLANFVLCCSPQRIIMGGGIMHKEVLFPKIRKKVQEILNSYVHHPSILEKIDEYIIPPGLGDQAGIIGSAYLGFDLISQ